LDELMPDDKFQLKNDPVQERLPLSAPVPVAPARPERRKRDSARLVWDSKPKRPPSPRDIEFQTAEVVIPNPARDAGTLPFAFRDGILDHDQIDRSKMNRLIWGDNLLAMQALLAQGYEGKIDLIYIDPPFDSKADYSHRMEICRDRGNKGAVCHREARLSRHLGGGNRLVSRHAVPAPPSNAATI